MTPEGEQERVTPGKIAPDSRRGSAPDGNPSEPGDAPVGYDWASERDEVSGGFDWHGLLLAVAIPVATGIGLMGYAGEGLSVTTYGGGGSGNGWLIVGAITDAVLMVLLVRHSRR